MKSQAAILWETNTPWSVEEIELDPPGPGEVLVKMAASGLCLSLLDLTVMEKQVVGSLFGSGNPRADIPKLIGLYRQGQLDLAGLVTKEYPLSGVNEGYEAMREGTAIRSVLKYD